MAQHLALPAAPIYSHGRELSAADRVTQIRHLALVGIAASDSQYSVSGLDDAFVSLFEVIHRLADEVNLEIENDQGA